MQFLLNLKVKFKVLLLVILGCFGLAVVAGMGFYVLAQAHESVGELKGGMEHVTLLESMKSDFLAMRLDLVYLLSLTDKATIDEKVADYRKRIESIKAGIDKNRKMTLSAEDKQLLDAFVSGFEAYLEKGAQLGDMAQKAAAEGRADRSDVVQFATVSVGPLYAKPAETIKTLVEHNLKSADVMYQQDTVRGRTLKLVLIAVFGGITVLAFAGGLLIANSINNPLQDVMGTLLKVASGDLTARSNVVSRDEMGVLAGEVNQMADRLSSAMRGVAENSTQVAAAATQLHATAEQIATGAEEVAAQAGTVATASEEMSATSADIANNCHMAADDSGRANNAANEGARVVESTVTVMARIANRVQESARTVETLGERSDQIGAIVATIEDIADQTNLLALNAAIEAARAGEMGRGFAVVADEVRALAERTTKATREIGEMIKSIQTETKAAVKVMEEGVAEVETGTMEAGKSGEALRQILDQVGNVTMQVNQIATAAEEQTATTTEITNNIQQISQVVQQTAVGAQETVDAANQLSRLSDDLRSLVAQFKI